MMPAAAIMMNAIVRRMRVSRTFTAMLNPKAPDVPYREVAIAPKVRLTNLGPDILILVRTPSFVI
jgi:hypothetical protein